MSWQLDRDTFRYLVGLYLVSFALLVAVGVYEALNPNLTAISEGLDALVEQQFGVGEIDETLELALAVFGGTVLVWHLASAFALRQFRRWARWSFWVTSLLIIAMMFLPVLGSPYYSTALNGAIEAINLGLSGAIVLLGYSREHGIKWFRSDLENLEETF